MIIFLIPFIGAFIGWLTNVIAITLLFRPYKPILGVQGLLPKYKDESAKRIGEVVKNYLLDNKTLANAFCEIDIEKVLKPLVDKIKLPIVKPILQNLLPAIAQAIKAYIGDVLHDLPNIIEIDKLVEEKIKNFDLHELERIIYQATGPEIRFIKLSGAILGFIIGWIQVGIVYFIK